MATVRAVSEEVSVTDKFRTGWLYELRVALYSMSVVSLPEG